MGIIEDENKAVDESSKTKENTPEKMEVDNGIEDKKDEGQRRFDG